MVKLKVAADDEEDAGLWDEIDRELDDVATPPLSPWQSRPSTRQGHAEPAAEQKASCRAESPTGTGQEDYVAGMERMDQSETPTSADTKTNADGKGRVVPLIRKLEPDPDTNHVMEPSDDGGPPRVVVKDTVAIRTAFLKYCNSRMRPPEMQRMLEHGMAGPCLTAPKLMAMCNELGLWQPKGPLSFLVVGSIFSSMKNDEVQGLLYPDFLHVLVQLALESNCNVAAQLQELHAAKPSTTQAPSAPSNGKLDPNLMHSVEDLVAGLPPVATQRSAHSMSNIQQRQQDALAGTQAPVLPPLPGPPPERFARIVPLLRSPSVGRLFTHAQIRELGAALGSGAGAGHGHSRRASATLSSTSECEPPAASSNREAASPEQHSARDGVGSAGSAPVAIPPAARTSKAGAGAGDADGVQPPGGPNGTRSNAPRPGLSRSSPTGAARKPPLLPTISARTAALRSSVPNTPSILAAAAAAAPPDSDGDQPMPSHPLHHASLLQSLAWSRAERRSDPGLGAPSPSSTRTWSKQGSRESS